MLAIELPPEVEAKLEALAKAAGLSTDAFVREALLEHIEDREDVRIADERMAAILSGEDEPVPLEEVMRKLGLDDQDQ